MSRHLRFELRSLLLAVAVTSVALAWWSSIRRQRLDIAALELANASARVAYRAQVDDLGRTLASQGAASTRLQSWLGIDAVSRPARLELAYPTDADLELVARLTDLRWLALARAIDVSDAGIRSLRKLRHLRGLDIDCADRLTDDGLAQLAQLTSLERLRLDLSGRVTNRGLLQLQNLKRLTSLTLALRLPLEETEGAGITAAGVAALRRALPRCQIEISGDEPLAGASNPPTSAELAELIPNCAASGSFGLDPPRRRELALTLSRQFPTLSPL